jgi:Nif-specific regulatory protein
VPASPHASDWLEPQTSDWLDPHAAEVRKLATLLEVSQALLSAHDLRAGLNKAFDVLRGQHGALRSAVVVLGDQGDVVIDASSTGNRSGSVPLGPGITTDVIRAGKPVIVPQVRSDAKVLHRPGGQSESRHQVSYICVPIAYEGATIGALSVDLPYKPNRDYERTAKFLSVVGSMVAQAVKVQRLIEADRQVLVDENAHLRFELKERYDFSNIVGTSREMQDVYQQVAQVAETNTTVLLRGESGTGKELIAHAIHYNSARAKMPFIKVSCAALPHDLIESELFGYEKGAFTGAYTAKKGRFELAEGGTIFLDEIGELSLATQVKLLRVLQAREFEPLGATRTVRANVRIITATNKDLEKAITTGSFREDLYYRLNVFAIYIPPLRERRPDILHLANHFLERFSVAHKKNVRRISTPAIDMLACYHWPGNVRELENAIERAVVVCNTQVLHAHHLPPTLQTAEASGTTIELSLEQATAAFEKDVLQDALKSARGNRAKAARLLSTTSRVFNYKVRKYEIDWKRFEV